MGKKVFVNKKGKEKELTKTLYTQEVKREWSRLIRDEFHKLEFDTTIHFLKKYLPKKGLVLDAGGGPGRYTIELAKKGYDVILFDLTPANLELAKKKIKEAGVENKVKAILEGSVTDLSMFPSNKFDAVVCLGGPISHIKGDKDRRKAITELKRVAKKNAPIFISIFGVFGTILNTPRGWPEEIKMTKHFKDLVYFGEDYSWHGGRGYAHFFRLSEITDLLKSCGLKVVERVGLEGLASPSSSEINKIFKDKLIKKNWLEMHYNLCTHPTVVDTSLHILLVCRK